jgi:transcriptional regulator with XRE-family HTH domain
MTIGKRMRQRRRALDITQEKLEELAGVKQSHISALESDRITVVKSDTLVRLAKALRVSADWLLGLQEEIEGERRTTASSAA